jgi:hypothetical protein
MRDSTWEKLWQRESVAPDEPGGGRLNCTGRRRPGCMIEGAGRKILAQNKSPHLTSSDTNQAMLPSPRTAPEQNWNPRSVIHRKIEARKDLGSRKINRPTGLRLEMNLTDGEN